MNSMRSLFPWTLAAGLQSDMRTSSQSSDHMPVLQLQRRLGGPVPGMFGFSSESRALALKVFQAQRRALEAGGPQASKLCMRRVF